MEVFDRSLTNLPIELHTKYLSNFHIKYISDPDQFVWYIAQAMDDTLVGYSGIDIFKLNRDTMFLMIGII
jgi:hypothetical protein